MRASARYPAIGTLRRNSTKVYRQARSQRHRRFGDRANPVLKPRYRRHDGGEIAELDAEERHRRQREQGCGREHQLAADDDQAGDVDCHECGNAEQQAMEERQLLPLHVKGTALPELEVGRPLTGDFRGVGDGLVGSDTEREGIHPGIPLVRRRQPRRGTNRQDLVVGKSRPDHTRPHEPGAVGNDHVVLRDRARVAQRNDEPTEYRAGRLRLDLHHRAVTFGIRHALDLDVAHCAFQPFRVRRKVDMGAVERQGDDLARPGGRTADTQDQARQDEERRGAQASHDGGLYNLKSAAVTCLDFLPRSPPRPRRGDGQGAWSSARIANSRWSCQVPLILR